LSCEILYEVIRKITIAFENSDLLMIDWIINQSNRTLTPDLGYHIIFKPEEG